MRTTAWKWTLVLGALTACNNPTSSADGGPDTGFIMLRDGGPTDGGPGSDSAAIDANLPPYDGGQPVMCTGLTPITITTYCAAYADAAVAHDVRCGYLGSAGATSLRAAIIAGCNVSRLQSRITAGTATLDGAMGACCFAHSAGDTDCYAPTGGGHPSCDFIHGTVAIGSSCVNSAECMDGYCHVDGACPGTCTAYAAPGTRCDLGDVACDAMSTCDTGYNGASHVCVRQTGVQGATCNAAMGTGCATGFACNVPTGSPSGTCRAHPHRGEACDANDILCDLRSSICTYDYASMAGLCTPALTVGTMRCIINLQCAGDAYCAGADYARMVYGTCTARAGRGASCMTDLCQSGLVCLPNHTCGDAPAIGQACSPASGCRQGICNGSGMCVALHAATDPCTANNQCVSGNCRAMGHTCAPDCNP